jgi:hypothetical protein
MDYMNLQQFSMVIGYVAQDLELRLGIDGKPDWTKFSVLSRQNDGRAIQLVCMASADIARQFVEQHTKGSIVCLFGEIIKRYDATAVNRISNQLNVLGWYYFADINAHFDDLNEEEHVYLSNRLKAFRASKPADRKKIMNKIAPETQIK